MIRGPAKRTLASYALIKLVKLIKRIKEVVMTCSSKLLGARWDHHTWRRDVIHTETQRSPITDQWGRVVPADIVICRTQEACRECGAVRDGGYCSCDLDRAERCEARLTWLDEGPTPQA